MKILIALLGFMASVGAFADDSQKLAERMSCADIQTKIVELSGITDPSEDDTATLEKLKTEYRSKCSRSAAKRKSSALKNTVVPATVTIQDDEPESVNTTETESADEIVEEAPVVTETEVVAEVESEIDDAALLEQELANLDAGLCIDGTKPNRFGCCTDEIFKDLGNSVFACCPKTGGDCFPPIQ